MATYKTIVLELLQEQYPALYERLRAGRTLLSEVNLHAVALKRYHETRVDQLALARPDSDESQIASEALELAIEDLKNDLRSESPTDGHAAEELSIELAMAYLQRHTPPT